MTNVLSFDNPDDMRAYLAEAGRRARAGLHPVQAAITYGDCWAQFYDVPDRIVVFGRVHLLDEVAEAERLCGGSQTDVDAVVASTRTDLEYGDLMFGTAYDRTNPTGELGHTHRLSVWPIEESLFNAAFEHRFVIDDLPDSAKINLQIAFSAWTAHVIGMARESGC